MSPLPFEIDEAARLEPRLIEKPKGNGLVLEGWAQGFMVGSLIIMSCITIANMRRGVLLHKLILIELLFGIWHGFWILLDPPAYSWWLSVSAILLNASWSLHNVIAWMKIKPFLSRTWSLLFIGTVILVQPYWVVEIYANFAYFHNINDIFLKTRPWEALCRDPWWILTVVILLWSIAKHYKLSIWEIVRISPRMGVMLGAMVLSIVFIVLDITSVTGALRSSLPTGINPFWKLSFVFKCLTDSVVLDDFKTALDRLRAFKMSHLGSFSVDNSDQRSRPNGGLEREWAAVKAANDPFPKSSPEGSPNFSSPQYESIRGPKSETRRLERLPPRALLRNPSRDRDSQETGPIIFRDRSPRNKKSSLSHDARDSSYFSAPRFSRDNTADVEYARALYEVDHDHTSSDTHHSHSPRSGSLTLASSPEKAPS